MAVNVSIRVVGQTVCIQLSGELDAPSVQEIRGRLEQACSTSPSRIVLELQELRYMASAGIRLLLMLKQRAGAAAELVLVGAQGPVLQTLKATGLHHSVTLLDSLPEDLAAVPQRASA